MKTKNIIPLFLFFACNAYSQDLHYSQFENVPMVINPANAGVAYKTRVNLNYRTQWASIQSPYKSFVLSADQRLSKNPSSSGYLGIGLNLAKENSGRNALGTLNGSLSLSGHVLLSTNSSLGIGIQGGYQQRSYGSSGLQWGSQFNGTSYDPGIQQSEFTTGGVLHFPDFSTGIIYRYDQSLSHYVTDNHDRKIVAGLSFNHLNRPAISYSSNDDKLPIRITLHANTLFSISNSNIAIGPGFLMQKQGSAMEILLGSKFRYSLVQASKMTGYNQQQSISLNAFYRLKDAIIFTLEYAYSDYSISMSYDVNVSKLTTFSNGRGGFEFSLQYRLRN